MKALLKKIGAGLLAALTTPEAIKAEKSLATIVLVRFAILFPGAAFVLDKLVEALS